MDRGGAARRVADAVGFHYAQDPATGEWAHMASIFVLTPDGKVSRYLYGIDFPPKDFRLSLVEAAGGRVGTSFDKLILTCFRYDPASRKYQPFAFGMLRLGGGRRHGGAGRADRRAGLARAQEGEADGMNELLRTLLFLPSQLSQHARDVDGLHYFVVITTMVAGFLIFGTALLFMIRYRRRQEGEATPEVQPGHWHEAIFVGVPLAFFLLWFAIGYPQYVETTQPPPGALDVFVQGKKWMWKFAYPGGPSSLDVLRVPAGRPVRLLITSRDVIHSFFVPDLRLKQDALPGRYTQTWFQAEQPGRYQVFCAEYCGLSHSGMLAELVVLPAAEFDQWIADQRRGEARAQDAALTAGERSHARLVDPRPGAPRRRRPGLPEVPLGGRLAPHRADLHRPLRPAGEAHHRRGDHRRRGLPDPVDDGSGGPAGRRLPERHAQLPGADDAPRGRRRRRVHQVAQDPGRRSRAVGGPGL